MLTGCGSNQGTQQNIIPSAETVQQEEVAESGETGYFQLKQRPFQTKYLNTLQLPPGFQVSVFAQGLQNPRMMLTLDNGWIYVTQPDAGSVIALRDENGDGRSDSQMVVVSGLSGVHGIAERDGFLYLATVQKVYRAPIQPDGHIGEPQVIISNLPEGGRHPKRTLGFDPDGNLYISIGSTCNACVESNKESATILKAKPEQWEREIFASGLRNTIGFDWHPTTQEMWGMDIGSDWAGANIPPEELNRLKRGKNYGWPWCYGNRQVAPGMEGSPPGATQTAYCQETEPAVLTYQAHSSPIGMVFYTGKQFPKAYQNDALVALRGSWNRKPAVGYKMVRIDFENGQPVAIQDFMTDFLLENGDAFFARIAGVEIAPDGSLLVSDDTNGVIYRVHYQE